MAGSQARGRDPQGLFQRSVRRAHRAFGIGPDNFASWCARVQPSAGTLRARAKEARIWEEWQRQTKCPECQTRTICTYPGEMRMRSGAVFKADSLYCYKCYGNFHPPGRIEPIVALEKRMDRCDLEEKEVTVGTTAFLPKKEAGTEETDWWGEGES